MTKIDTNLDEAAIRKLIKENRRLMCMELDSKETWNSALEAAINAAYPWLNSIDKGEQLNVQAAINAIRVLREAK